MKSNISDELKNKAKAVSIVGLLESQGLRPIRETGGELVYLSPLREEKTPSFHVNESLNCFYDFGGTDMNGDAITFTCLYWRIGFKEAVQRLLGLQILPTPSFSFSGLETSKRAEKGIKVLSIRNLQHPALIQYVQDRGISMRIANQYLKEVTYQIKSKQYFAVGFLNDAGGFDLKNGIKDFKGAKSLNGITTFNLQTDSVSIFEGYFDFLSALEYYGRLYPRITTIVLNSCNNLNKALPILANRKTVHCYLDNDTEGRRTLERMKSKGLPVKNWSELLYPSCKDFNEHLLESRKEVAVNRT